MSVCEASVRARAAAAGLLLVLVFACAAANSSSGLMADCQSCCEKDIMPAGHITNMHYGEHV